ncbi:MAG: hypothetical protein E5V62_03210 [Mesorhizobium sp.]|uniref:hypothetical protein n=1 Tax=Mesorhizobium sp. TaxID=1871066 RepID=UPI00120CD53C|nr:hypothetical protein [Mesorhizobium sp.]TIW37172.1 MAG: hypothetical protein E5V62_03210 [Mesorhizobium sp.]
MKRFGQMLVPTRRIVREAQKAADVEEIVAAVAATAPLPKRFGMSRRRLRMEIGKAWRDYRIVDQLVASQPWDARRKLIEKHLAWARAFPKLSTGDREAGKWLAEQLGSSYPDELTKSVRRHEERLITICQTFWPEDQKEGNFGLQSVADILGRQSPLEWLIGQRLRDIFERFFRMPATRGMEPSRWEKDGMIHYGEPKHGPFLAFVLAVLAEPQAKELGIEASAATVRRYLKGPVRRKTGTKIAKK